MLEQLRQDLHNEAYEVTDPVNGEPSMVVGLDDIDSIIKKHSYMKLRNFLETIAPYQLIALKAGTTLTEYDFLGTAGIAINGGIQESFKNISGKPFELNVSKVDVRTGLNVYADENGSVINTPVIFIFVN